ncbi:MAG: alpha/beta hydrolase, partial [Salinibacterium sp.]
MSKDQHPDSVAGRIVTGTAIGLGAVAALAAVSAGAITAVFARTVLIPPRRRTEEVHILSHDESTITLSPTLDSMTPGRYSFWFHQTDGHARIGEIVSYTATSVTRELLAVDFGDLDSAKHGRFSGWFYLSPAELGFPFEDVEIATDLGPAPAWLIPAAQKGTRWVIQVHGRAVRRPEGLRAVPVFREAGYNSLLISYRNDGDAPESADNRYALGDTEWNDVAAAIRFAHARGAEQ